MMHPNHPHRTTLKKSHLALLAIIIALSIFIWIIQLFSTLRSEKCIVSHGTYAGSIYTKPDETLANKCLVESPWMRLAQHSVRISNDGMEGKVIDDWLWIDYHDRINVLVEAPHSAGDDGDGDNGDGEPSFLILSQTKYALPSDQSPSLAIVGGIIEPHEEALLAAQREVQEELHVICKNWKVLGNKFRTDVNRGMGWVHPYLARDCSYANNIAGGGEESIAVVGGHDTEKQRIQIMKFSEVKGAVMDGRFVEVQWSNTVALAMLHLLSNSKED
eukprot:CAMPEP_0183728422 /NCGR_PEP_ID=MMETSP0737-20130205/28022_1 /TAXON_ID=385413 /ORGANISM="Thalassiosira miniscula, Strain CCMP1093" /LENGTH=273 /DNA_ID=CAMNT_0025960359 /DNA_START=172 /DNA_END=993 /DNA_ORIENTATION=+